MAAGRQGNLKRPAVFLDRDGVLTEEKSYIACVKELSVFSYAASCVRRIHEKGYYAIVVTNQSGVARGLFTEKRLKEMNRYLMEQTGVDAVYYCPHHPEGKVEAYRRECRCRKPGAGMIEQACRDFDIDLGHSYMVGDRAGDILAGQNVGVKTVLVESGYGSARLESQVMADYVLEDLRELIYIL